jgi:uncharacterized protein (TIGR03086 family)
MTCGTEPLGRAISYAVGAVSDVTPALLPRPTPCRGWNLEMLLKHACESLAAVQEGMVTGCVGLIPASWDLDLAVDPARSFRDRAGQLLAARAAGSRRQRIVDVADLTLPAIVMEYAGAVEITIHGWDISQACGQRRPIPDMLAIDLLAVAPLLIPETGRRPLFDAPVAATAPAGPGDRLVAYLGRRPGR